jgi:hypothetical protein
MFSIFIVDFYGCQELKRHGNRLLRNDGGEGAGEGNSPKFLNAFAICTALDVFTHGESPDRRE